MEKGGINKLIVFIYRRCFLLVVNVGFVVDLLENVKLKLYLLFHATSLLEVFETIANFYLIYYSMYPRSKAPCRMSIRSEQTFCVQRRRQDFKILGACCGLMTTALTTKLPTYLSLPIHCQFLSSIVFDVH